MAETKARHRTFSLPTKHVPPEQSPQSTYPSGNLPVCGAAMFKESALSPRGPITGALSVPDAVIKVLDRGDVDWFWGMFWRPRGETNYEENRAQVYTGARHGGSGSLVKRYNTQRVLATSEMIPCCL